MNVVIIGAGKVGRALAQGLRATKHSVKLVPARRARPRLRGRVDLVVLAVRDPELPALARELAEERWVPRGAAVVHVAGALGPEVLAPLRPHCAGIGLAHPLASFASARHPPRLDGALLLVAGDRAATRRAGELGRSLGLAPATWRRVDAASYHAAAALAANGAVALIAAAAQVLVDAGAPRRPAERALGKLLASVAENIGHLGLPGALTGPIRRGDAQAIARHRAALSRQGTEIKELYSVLGRIQLELSRQLGEASPDALDEVARALRGKAGAGR